VLAHDLSLADVLGFDPDTGRIDFCGRRAMLVHADALGALRKELVDTLGLDTARVILTRYGFSCGQNDARHVERVGGFASAADFVMVGPRLHMFGGVARVVIEKLSVPTEGSRYAMAGTWHASYEAEQHLRLFGPAAEPVCWTLAGYASGFSSTAFDTPMICIEDCCVARHDPQCAWRLVSAASCGPELDEHRKAFMPLDLAQQINLLEQKVEQRTADLRVSESRYRDLVDNLPEIIFSLDPLGRLVHLNRAGRQRLRIDPEGGTIPLARLMPLKHRRRLVRLLHRIGETRAEGRIEVTLRSLSDEDIAVQLQLSPIMDGDRLTGYRGLAIDIGPVQARERKLAEYASTLESQLLQATRLAGLGQFASGIAHEINNPIGLISAYAEDLLDTLGDRPDAAATARLRNGLAIIQDQAYRCKAITRNVLSFARDQAVNLETSDIGALVREKVHFFTERASASGLDVHLDVAPALPPVRTDPILLGQVLLNLLKNAAEALNGRGTVWVGLAPSRNRMRLEVADNGPGLAPDIIDKVFDPFFTTKAPDQGTGLGLSICYGIVRSLGGNLSCGNRQAGGAWFRVSLPLTGSERGDA